MRRRSLQKMLLGVCSLWLAHPIEAQITKKIDFKNKASDTIGTFQGIKFREAGFSGLYAVPHTNGKEFWTVSDRGVNVDAANANPSGCKPTYDKIYGFEKYTPKIHRIKLNTSDSTITILQTITLKRPNGTNTSGLLNPTGYGSTATETVSLDTVLNCANFAAKTAAKDIWGIDSEGLVVDKDGNFWICEEGGPTIWKISRNGLVLQRFTPYAHLANKQAIDVQIDTVFKYRKNNRGFEGIALTPSGKVLAIIQSPLLFPNKTVGEATRVHRLVEIDPATNKTRMFAYLNEGLVGDIRLKDWKISDLAAINDTTFLVLEAAANKNTDIKKIYRISLNSATEISEALYNGKTLEALVDSAGLAANGIRPVKKSLALDLLAHGWPAELDKAEGLAVINDSTIAIANDNDYGQSSPTENGVATATGKLSHLIVFALQGSHKLANYLPAGIAQNTPSVKSSQTSYVTPLVPEGRATAILTAGDAIGGYKMAGLPDGLGAFDNDNGTFTLLMNHEITSDKGIARAHGGKGAFVSKWIINKSDLSVVSGSDLIQNVKLWNTTTSSYETFGPGDTTKLKHLTRFCSADLALPSAYYNAATGKGTMARIFMNGEESDNKSRAFGHLVTGTEAGTTYELPRLGKAAWENAVASPNSGDKTVVGLMNDGSTTGSKVYFYVGTKTNTGSDVEKAGLTNGKLLALTVEGYKQERASATVSNPVPTPGTRFTFIDLGNVENLSGQTIDTIQSKLRTNFARPEDGAWDPQQPNDFYFNTTDQFDQVNDGLGSQIGRSHLWRLRFDDVKNPETGGTIEAVLDGTEGHNMLDNLTIDKHGRILLNEDVGNSVHNGKVWEYNIATDSLRLVAKHDTARFGDVGIPAKAPFNVDEETSGIIDVEDILGENMFLTVDQAHYAIPGELVEGGQLLALYIPKPDVITSLEDSKTTSESSSMALYPNPAGDKATLSIYSERADKASIVIYDLQGNAVAAPHMTNVAKGSQQIDLGIAQLENGIYMVHVTTSLKTTRIKMAVLR